MRSRGFTITINNYTFDDIKGLLELYFHYMCFGFEIAPHTGTPHIQGYIYFNNAKTLEKVRKLIPRAHIEIARGTCLKNQIYTSKTTGDWYEFGEPIDQGRAKWELIEEVMKEPQSNPHLYNQYNKMYRQLTLSTKRDHKRELYFFPYEKKYQIAKLFDQPFMNADFEAYDGEIAMILPTYADNFIEDWINGYPQKFRRGYELICVDPAFVILLYCNAQEQNYIIKKYSEYIECPVNVEKAIESLKQKVSQKQTHQE